MSLRITPRVSSHLTQATHGLLPRSIPQPHINQPARPPTRTALPWPPTRTTPATRHLSSSTRHLSSSTSPEQTYTIPADTEATTPGTATISLPPTTRKLIPWRGESLAVGEEGSLELPMIRIASSTSSASPSPPANASEVWDLLAEDGDVEVELVDALKEDPLEEDSLEALEEEASKKDPQPEPMSSVVGNEAGLPPGKWNVETVRLFLEGKGPAAFLLKARPGVKAWELTEDGMGVEKGFVFKGFGEAWKFMHGIQAESKRVKHHPEWSNKYRNVFVRWTTHDPLGLTVKDLRMADFCNQNAARLKELPTDFVDERRMLDEVMGDGRGKKVEKVEEKVEGTVEKPVEETAKGIVERLTKKWRG